MARSTTDVALQLLEALQDEWQREPDFLKCRTLGVVAGDICESQEEFDRVTRFITSDGLIKAVRRKDGLASRPSEAGLAWMERQKEKQVTKAAPTREREPLPHAPHGQSHLEIAMPLHRQIITTSGILAASCILGGIVAVLWDAKSKTEFEVLGAHLTTGHVGVAFMGVGVVIGFFTVRAVLRSQRDLAHLRLRERSYVGLDVDQHLPLELELSIRDNGILSQKGVLVVRNPSEHTSADDVQIKLLEINPQPIRNSSDPMAWLAVKEEFKSEPARAIHPRDSSEYDAFVFNSENLGFGVSIHVALRSSQCGLSFYAEPIPESLPPTFKDYTFTIAASARGRPQSVQQFKVAFDQSGKTLAVIVSNLPKEEGSKREMEAQALMAEQNRLLRKQVEIVKNSQLREADRERRESMPFFRWGGGTTWDNDSLKTSEFENLGGVVTSLETSTDAAVNLRILPTQVLLTNQMGKIEFQSHRGALPAPFQFQIAYTTKLGERLTKRFLLQTARGTPQEQP